MATTKTLWTKEEVDYRLNNHTHTKSQITNFPTYLPNQYSLTIKGLGDSVVYNGSSSKVCDLSNVATKDYVSSLLGDIVSFKAEVVSSLPTTGVDGVIYLIADTHGTNDIYDEYIWTGNGFEKLGNTDINLSGYVKGSGLTANAIVLGNGTTNVKISSYTITTGDSTSSTQIMTASAVNTRITNRIAKTVKNPALLSSSVDLNTLCTSSDIGFYYVGGGNSIANKPSGVDAFGLEIRRSAGGWVQQILYASNTNTDYIYSRTSSGSSSGFTSWVRIDGRDKQSTLSSTQLSAVNSGITASKVANYDNYEGSINKLNYKKLDRQVYSTSTSDSAGAWTVTIPNINELYEGLTIKVRIKKAGISGGSTLNLNGLGALPVYVRYGTRLTTHYAVESILDMTYTASAASGVAGWLCENYYDTTNTYQLRKNGANPLTQLALYRYKLCATKGDKILPLSTANITSATATTSRALTSESFDPFGEFFYYASTTTVSANGAVTGTSLYYVYHSLDLRYTFNNVSLTTRQKVYLKCHLSTADGGYVVLDGYTQTEPTSEDGYIYILIGTAVSTTNVELSPNKTVYAYKNNAFRIWTGDNRPIVYLGTINTQVENAYTQIYKAMYPTSIGGMSTSETEGNIVCFNTEGFVDEDSMELGSGYYIAIPTGDNGVMIITNSGMYSLYENEATLLTQPKLVSGSNIKTINNSSLLGSGNISVQSLLVSGTNIKTINGSSILGSGNLTIATEVDLPTATSTVLGGVKLGSDTVQTVAASSVSSTASRTYAVQANSSGQLVVNVPWSNSTSYIPLSGSSSITGNLIPSSDGFITLGSSSKYWSDIYGDIYHLYGSTVYLYSPGTSYAAIYFGGDDVRFYPDSRSSTYTNYAVTSYTSVCRKICYGSITFTGTDQTKSITPSGYGMSYFYGIAIAPKLTSSSGTHSQTFGIKSFSSSSIQILADDYASDRNICYFIVVGY